MYRHPKTTDGFFNMKECFEEKLYKWASKKGINHYFKSSNSCVFSKSVYIEIWDKTETEVLSIRISDHSAKHQSDLYLYWDDFKNPAEALKKVKEIAIQFHENGIYKK